MAKPFFKFMCEREVATIRHAPWRFRILLISGNCRLLFFNSDGGLLVRPNKTRGIRNFGAQFGVESVLSIYISYDPSPGRIFGFVFLHVLILQFTVFLGRLNYMSQFLCSN